MDAPFLRAAKAVIIILIIITTVTTAAVTATGTTHYPNLPKNSSCNSVTSADDRPCIR